MGDGTTIQLVVPSSEFAEFAAAIELPLDLPGDEGAAGESSAAGGSERARGELNSAAMELTGIVIAGAAALKGLAPVLVAYVKATRGRHVRIVREDGSSVEINGNYSVEDVLKIAEESGDADRPPEPADD